MAILQWFMVSHGRTQEYLPSVAVNQVANVLNPIKIQIRENTLESMNVFMRVNEQIEIQYEVLN